MKAPRREITDVLLGKIQSAKGPLLAYKKGGVIKTTNPASDLARMLFNQSDYYANIVGVYTSAVSFHMLEEDLEFMGV